MHFLATVRGLSANEWKYLFAALVVLPLIDVSLRLRGFGATARFLERSGTRPIARLSCYDADQSDRLCLEIARAVSVAARRTLWPTSCLRQALAVRYFLARRGLESELRLGVQRGEQQTFAAHAWLERNGKVLIGGELAPSRYASLM